MADMVLFPAPEEDEPGAEYWDRIRQLDRPFPWDTDKSLPPGRITVSEEWATRDKNGHHWMCTDKEQAHDIALSTGSVAVRRVRWISIGEWQEAKDE
jgi:hypothetical protein